MEVSKKNGWFPLENPIKIDDRVPLFHETTIYIYIYIYREREYTKPAPLFVRAILMLFLLLVSCW